MPCITPEPSRNELEQHKMANLLLYLNKYVDVDVTDELLSDAQYTNSGISNLDKYTKLLCEICSRLEKHEILSDLALYDGRDPESRKLADWWDNHKEFDNERIKSEALAKLTEREKEVLGLK